MTSNPIPLTSVVEGIENVLLEAMGIEGEKKRHKFVQNRCYAFFTNLGFHAYREYKITILRRHTLARKKEKEEPFRRLVNGAIDIYAHSNQGELGVEFDSKRVIKWGSLEKLCQSNARICIAIVIGPKELTAHMLKACIEENKSRIIQVILETIKDYIKRNKRLKELTQKRFWLGVLRTCLLQEIEIDYKGMIESVLKLINSTNTSLLTEKGPYISEKSFKVIHAKIMDNNNKSLLLYWDDLEKPIWVPKMAVGDKYDLSRRDWQEIEVQKWFLDKEGLLELEEVLSKDALRHVLDSYELNVVSERALEVLQITLKNYLTDILATTIELAEHSNRTKIFEKDVIFADELVKLRYK